MRQDHYAAPAGPGRPRGPKAPGRAAGPDTALPADDAPPRAIGEMCADFGVTPRTLRFYEAMELIAPIRQGQRRLYTRRCAARLRLILRGKRFGFSLEDIRQLLDLYDLGDQQVTQLARTRALGTERLAAMRAQRDELTLAIAELEDQLVLAADLLAQRSGATG